MTNKNYAKGRRFEYQIRKEFQSRGYEVMRTSGSHGTFDLVAVRHNSIMLIQCKVTKSRLVFDKLIKDWIHHPPFPPYDFPVKQVLAVKHGTTIHYQYI